MEADSFNDLALRVLAGEATGDERRALDVELSAKPERRDEFERLKLTHSILRTAAPLTKAVSAAGEPELPSHRLNELRTAVRQHFGPAARHPKIAFFSEWSLMRWIFTGGGATVLTTVAVLLFFANRSIEVGMYGTGLTRSGSSSLSPDDVPDAKLLTFDQDAPFDQWQSNPLAWYQRGKIWVDNEQNVLHVVHRLKHGQIIIQSLPLAPTPQGQREQIKQVVELLER